MHYLVQAMDPTQWTPTEAAYLLSDAYASSMQEDGADPNFTTLQTLALSADPDYMAEVWDAWCEEMEQDGLSAKQIDDAHYWLDVTVLQDLSIDDAAATSHHPA